MYAKEIYVYYTTMQQRPLNTCMHKRSVYMYQSRERYQKKGLCSFENRIVGQSGDTSITLWPSAHDSSVRPCNVSQQNDTRRERDQCKQKEITSSAPYSYVRHGLFTRVKCSIQVCAMTLGGSGRGRGYEMGGEGPPDDHRLSNLQDPVPSTESR